MADGFIKVIIGVFLLSFWGILLLQQHYNDAQIESLVKKDVQQSYRKRNLFLKEVDVKLVGKGSLTPANELPIKVKVQYQPPFCPENPCRQPVDKTVDLLVSKNRFGEMIIKSRNGVDLDEMKEPNVL